SLRRTEKEGEGLHQSYPLDTPPRQDENRLTRLHLSAGVLAASNGSSYKLLRLVCLTSTRRGIFVQHRQERPRVIRRRNFAVQNGLKRHHAAIQNVGFILVLLDNCSIQVNSSKDAACSRVRHDF